jgi:hypothetical protein
MADTAKSTAQDPEIIQEQRLREGFSAAIGQGIGKVFVTRKDKRDGKKYNCGSYDIHDGDYDAFIEELRSDYPAGGEYICRVVGEGGKTITNGLINLDPNPRAKKEQPATQASAGDSNFERMMMMMMQMQQQMFQVQQASSDRTMTAVMGVVTAMIQSQGKNQDSPADMLNAIIEAQAKLRPPVEDPGMIDKVLDMMGKIRAVLPESGPPEGIGGVIQSFAPVLAAMAAQQKPAAPQPQRAYVVTPAVPPPGAAPAAQPQAATADSTVAAPGYAAGISPEDPQAQMFQKYQPLMFGIRNIIMNADPSQPSTDISADVADFVDLGVRAGQIDVNDLNMLIQAMQTMPDQVAPTLAVFGITEPAHVQIIIDAIPILTGGVEG